jgi:cytochrome c oxidase subunit II
VQKGGHKSGSSPKRQPAWQVAAALLYTAATALAGQGNGPASPTSIFAPESTPAHSIYDISIFVVEITAAIFVVVASLLLYAVVKFRQRRTDDETEPSQVYGSNQIELAWTVIPVLIVVVLFLSTAQVIHRVEDARRPSSATDVTVVGHQFWWEYRYPQFGFTSANELHVPVSNASDAAPTFLTLLSADTDHSFWVPRLAGKTDLIPNRTNKTWISPQQPGLYLGQCAQYCGTEHAEMLLRVYVQPREEFDRWVREQQQAATLDPSVAAGRRVFETTACINCHTVRGTVADGRFGPDLTHLMSRETLASGIISNNAANLREWIHDPDAIKPGSLMPAMNLSDPDLDQVTAYLLTLH